MFERELTLEELLADPVIGLVMSSDGCTAEDIRHLMRVTGRRVGGTGNHTKPMAVGSERCRPPLKASAYGLVRNVICPVQHQMEPAGRLADGRF
jgi:hypothetical protein